MIGEERELKSKGRWRDLRKMVFKKSIKKVWKEKN